MSDDIYCGIGKVPKNKRIGTMKECADANQIRQYGIKKVDKKLLEHMEAEKKRKNSSAGKIESKSEKIGIDLAILMGKIKKLKEKIKFENDKQEKKELEKELVSLENKKNKLNAEYAILNKAKSKGKVKSKSKSARSTKKKSKSKSKSKSSKLKKVKRARRH